jgi:hypothetical protein
MGKQPGTSRIRIELTETQKELIRQATGREVKWLELRLQGGPEPAAEPEGAAEPDMPTGPVKWPGPEERKWG